MHLLPSVEDTDVPLYIICILYTYIYNDTSVSISNDKDIIIHIYLAYEFCAVEKRILII